MIRKIIEIDEEKCTGCSLCVNACHEGAIKLINGKAKLIKDDYCDGLGDCLPHCPADAIRIVKKDVALYNHEAVVEHIESIGHSVPEVKNSVLKNWPIQIKLAATNAECFNGAHLLIAADCCGFSFNGFQETFMKKRVTLIGCPKLDMVNYALKLTEIFKNNDIKSITIVRMEVPCCGGLTMAVKNAIIASGKEIPYSIRVISTKGEIIECI